MYVEHLKEASKNNAAINGSYIISKLEVKTFKAKSGFFLQCDLTDKTGSVKGIVWDRADILQKCLKNKAVFRITGEATRYNDVPQIVIKTAVKEDAYNPADFMPSLKQDLWEQHIEYLRKTSEGIKDRTCRYIWDTLTNPDESKHPEYLKKFSTCPGGVGEVIHHSYIGGLLEHTASMVRLGEHLCLSRPELDRDMLLTGCLIHDIGKILTYNWATVIEMTDQGRLLHHTTLGVRILDIILASDDLTKLHLAHIIVSHHQEEGVRKPMTLEAEAVAQIDSLDAATKGIQQYTEEPSNRQEEGNWTRYCSLTSRQYYLGERPVTESPVESKQDSGRKLAPGIIEESLF